jgi:hypothetical protein
MGLICRGGLLILEDKNSDPNICCLAAFLLMGSAMRRKNSDIKPNGTRMKNRLERNLSNLITYPRRLRG